MMAHSAPVRIIGLAGRIGAGKSTAAAILEREHGYCRTRFAAPLKAMLRAFLCSAGVAPAEIDRMIEGDRKETPAAALCGASPRRAMQTLGTEWGRGLVHADLWTTAWRLAVEDLIRLGHRRLLVEDVRFANEAHAVRDAGGVVWRLSRPAADVAAAAHVSEQQDFPADAAIANDGTVAALAARLGEALELLSAAP